MFMPMPAPFRRAQENIAPVLPPPPASAFGAFGIRPSGARRLESLPPWHPRPELEEPPIDESPTPQRASGRVQKRSNDSVRWTRARVEYASTCLATERNPLGSPDRYRDVPDPPKSVRLSADATNVAGYWENKSAGETPGRRTRPR